MATSTTNIASAGPAPSPSQAPRVVSTHDAAQVLFGPLLYPHYIGWQASILTYGGAQFPGSEILQAELFNSRRSDVLGDLPSLLHYKYFMCYMIQAGSQIVFSEYFQRERHHQTNGQHQWTPFLCGHRPHPGNKLRVSLMCSRCLIRHNHDTLERIDAARQLFESQDEDGLKVRKPTWRLCSIIWSYQKSQWRGIVDAVEIEAVHEARWESEQRDRGLNVEQAVAGTIHSSEVLKETFTCPFMADYWDLKITPKVQREGRSRPAALPLRLDVACANRGISSRTAASCSGGSCTRLDTCEHNVADCPCKSRFLNGGVSKESANRSFSLDTITSSSPRASLIVPQVMRTRVWWAEDVVDSVKTSWTSQYRTRSPWHEPGRWARREGNRWKHPHCPDYTSDEDDSDDNLSDDEDLDDTDSEVPVVEFPKPKPLALQHLLAQGQTSLGPTVMQKVAIEGGISIDTTPLAAYGETSIKRRRLNHQKPAFFSEWSDSNWQEQEAKGEAAYHASIRKNHVQGLSLEGNSRTVPKGINSNNVVDRAGARPEDKRDVSVNLNFVTADNETRIKQRRLNDEAPEVLSEATNYRKRRKETWDGEVQEHDKVELKN